ncbi:MAG TPA: YdcF family protein [Phycisphaerae bacterium]|nr:YdcF family protein [Phycisphaerae bacterium]
MATAPDGNPQQAMSVHTAIVSPRRRSCWRFLRWIEHLLAAVSALLLLMLVSPIPDWLFVRLDRQSDLRPAKYIICLGGPPSRVIEGARLLSEGYAESMIVSNNEVAAPMMRSLAIDWGAPPERVLVDPHAYKTLDHPGSVQRSCGVDPARDVCIIVTSYIHMARSKACFEKAGYKHIIMREPRWEREFRPPPGIKTNYWLVPELIYEYAALAEYWLRGAT